MPTTRSALFAALILVTFTGPMHAQDLEPSAEAPAAEEKPHPKPKPKLVRPKALPTAAPTPVATTSSSGPVATAIWPAGAKTLSESYGDWTMSCVRPTDKVACVVAQSQGDSKTGRRKFGIELKPPRDGQAEGIVVMPFGVAIEPGVAFKLDDQALGKGAPYVSCNDEGCLVSISFPTLATDAMRTAKASQ